METRIRPIDESSLAEAKAILENGGVVAFPTETVYGLGGDARSDEAVDTIYRVKGRPADNPLIVHVHREYDLKTLICDEQPYAAKLRSRFLPGPLTLVYRSRGKVSAKVSCGLDTLAVRVPSHLGAQRFLRCVDMPIAAPSANVSKHVSPVTAEHVYTDLQGRIPLILDGGACIGGIESTVCDVTGDIPVVLREGLISREQIADVVGRCELYVPVAGAQVRSPGMKYKHYAPACKTYLFAADAVEEAVQKFCSCEEEGANVFALCENSVSRRFPADRVLNLGDTGEEMAARLYALLRRGEQVADVIVAVRPRGEDGIMAGVQNRLGKACAGE